ncbi:metal-dependent phosphohydrolase [Emticicia sp. ODNR4P]|nr:metal-dependent phosphohydrolase [Emticicia sp. ODNR4P]
MENLFTPDCIRTHSGLYVNVFEPTVDMICIEDIAHGLAHTCRFAGHTNRYFSVAEHSTQVVNRLSIDYKPLLLKALLHDATEAYIGDIATPIKKRLPDYQKLESNLQKVIFQKFSLDDEIPEEIKKADRLQLLVEWDQMVIYNKPWNLGLKPMDAKALFLSYYRAIGL